MRFRQHSIRCPTVRVSAANLSCCRTHRGSAQPLRRTRTRTTPLLILITVAIIVSSQTGNRLSSAVLYAARNGFLTTKFGICMECLEVLGGNRVEHGGAGPLRGTSKFHVSESRTSSRPSEVVLYERLRIAWPTDAWKGIGQANPARESADRSRKPARPGDRPTSHLLSMGRSRMGKPHRFRGA